MSQTFEFYDQRAKAAEAEAACAVLENVRERELRSAKAWREMADRQRQIYDRVLAQGIDFYHSVPSSDLITRVTHNAQAARGVLDTLVTGFVRDLLTLVGRTQDTAAATKMLGVADRPTDITDMAFVGAAIVIGGLIGALVFKVAGVPLTLSTAGGALIAGIIGGWLRSVRPSFGRIPTPTVWFMNSVGLNIFIAIVGISAGPGFVNGLKTQGIGLFLWGVAATTIPLILGMFTAKYLFRFHDALTLGIVSGSRTTTASLGLVCDQAKSQIPALGYTVTYAVGNTLLTIWGMVIIMLLS